jgi:hypothetical protein
MVQIAFFLNLCNPVADPQRYILFCTIRDIWQDFYYLIRPSNNRHPILPQFFKRKNLWFHTSWQFMLFVFMTFINFHCAEFYCNLRVMSHTSCTYVVSVLIVFLLRDTLKIVTRVTETCWWKKYAIKHLRKCVFLRYLNDTDCVKFVNQDWNSKKNTQACTVCSASGSNQLCDSLSLLSISMLSWSLGAGLVIVGEKRKKP